MFAATLTDTFLRRRITGVRKCVSVSVHNQIKTSQSLQMTILQVQKCIEPGYPCVDMDRQYANIDLPPTPHTLSLYQVQMVHGEIDTLHPVAQRASSETSTHRQSFNSDISTANFTF